MDGFDAADYAESLSCCEKRPCGFAIEVNDEIHAIGFNHGDNEECNCTKDAENPNVLHAEIHALQHAKFLVSENAIGFSTYICCFNCCKELLKRGIVRLYYRDHRNEESKQKGINYLKQNGVEVRHYWKGKERAL